MSEKLITIPIDASPAINTIPQGDEIQISTICQASQAGGYIVRKWQTHLLACSTGFAMTFEFKKQPFTVFIEWAGVKIWKPLSIKWLNVKVKGSYTKYLKPTFGKQVKAMRGIFSIRLVEVPDWNIPYKEQNGIFKEKLLELNRTGSGKK